MSKLIQISIDSGSNWLTLPGSSGTLSVDGDTLDDTIFGAEYKSQYTGILNWKVEANAFYKGIAGYLATIKKAGSATTLTNQAASLVSGKTYQITDTTKQVLDRATAVTVKDSGTDVTSHVDTYDYLMGMVTFASDYTVVGAITITGKYLPLATLGKAKTWDLKQTADTKDTTDLATAQGNGGFSTFTPGLRTVTLDLKGFYDVTSGLRASLGNRDELIIEINPDGSQKSICRGFFLINSEAQNGDVGALEEESTSFVLNVPSSDYVPFNWYQASDTTLHASIQALLTAWLDGDVVMVKYLHDGTNGISGDAVATDLSLSGGVNAINTFTANFTGSGEMTTVGAG